MRHDRQACPAREADEVRFGDGEPTIGYLALNDAFAPWD
jgi:hypothetical protein